MAPLSEAQMINLLKNYTLEDYSDEYVFPGLLDLNVDLLDYVE